MFDRRKQLMWSKLKVGIIVTLALSTLFMAVFFAGTIQDIFLPKVELKAQIQDVKGLRKGAPVWISGIEVGLVDSIDLDPVYGTIIVISVNKSAMGYIKKDSQASVLTMGLLGDKYIEVTTGSPYAESIKPGETIKGAAQVDLKDVMEVSTVSIQRLSDFIKKLENLLTKIEKGEGTVSKFLTDPAVYDNLRDTTKTLSLIAQDVKNSHGTFKLLIEDTSLYNKMLAASSSLEEFVRKLNEGNGTLKKLIEDAALYENLNKSSLQLSSILERIDKGEGIAGSLINDKQLTTELKGTISELKELTKDIKEHPKKYFKFSIF